jgi:hypothetical protein
VNGKMKDELVVNSHLFPLQSLMEQFSDIETNLVSILNFEEEDFKRVLFFYHNQIIVYKATRKEVKILMTHDLEEFNIK